MATTHRTNRNLIAEFRVEGEPHPFSTNIREGSVASFGKALERALDHFGAGFFPLPEGSKARRPWKRAEPVWADGVVTRKLVGWRLADGRLLTHESFRKVAGGLVPA